MKKGFAFIEYEDHYDAMEALEKMHGYKIDREEIVVTKATPREEKKSNRLFVVNFPKNWKNEDLEDFFSKSGKVKEATIIRGFAFIEYHDIEDASHAITKFNDYEIEGERMAVKIATNKADKNDSRGGRDGGRSERYGGGRRDFDSRRDRDHRGSRRDFRRRSNSRSRSRDRYRSRNDRDRKKDVRRSKRYRSDSSKSKGRNSSSGSNRKNNRKDSRNNNQRKNSRSASQKSESSRGKRNGNRSGSNPRGAKNFRQEKRKSSGSSGSRNAHSRSKGHRAD